MWNNTQPPCPLRTWRCNTPSGRSQASLLRVPSSNLTNAVRCPWHRIKISKAGKPIISVIFFFYRHLLETLWTGLISIFWELNNPLQHRGGKNQTKIQTPSGSLLRSLQRFNGRTEARSETPSTAEPSNICLHSPHMKQWNNCVCPNKHRGSPWWQCLLAFFFPSGVAHIVTKLNNNNFLLNILQCWWGTSFETP